MTVIAIGDRRVLIPVAWSVWSFGRWSYRRAAGGGIERRGLSGPWVPVRAVRDVPILPVRNEARW